MRTLLRPFFRSIEESGNEGGAVKELENLRTGVGSPNRGNQSQDATFNAVFPSENAKNLIEPAYRKLPLISGILVPFSLLLSIPGLTGHWYVRTDGAGLIVETRRNTTLLDVSMGISLACGVLANTCLVVRFSERNVKVMTLLCIFWLTIHDVINILVVTVFGLAHRFDDGFTYGQPFWLTVCSTVASTSTNIALISDYKHTRQFQFKGSGLTHKQRSLMIAIIILLSYLALGSLVQAIMLKITFIEALYFSVVSIETIGFGDIHPNSTATRVFTVIYVSIGILNLALTVALTREALLEEAAVSFQARIATFRNRVLRERMRYRWKTAIRKRLQAQGVPVWIPQENLAHHHKNSVDSHRLTPAYLRSLPKTIAHTLRTHLLPASRQEGTHLYRPRPRQLNVEGLSQMQLESAAKEAGISVADLQLFVTPQQAPAQIQAVTIVDVPPNHRWLGDHRSWFPSFMARATAPDVDSMALDDGDITATPHTLEAGGEDMTVQDADSLSLSIAREERAAFAARLALSWMIFIVFWMVGSLIFMKTEGWAFGTSVYFCFVSFTTLGYGELAPQTPAGRAIFVAWALVGVATMTILLSILSDAYSRRYKAIIKTDDNALFPQMEDSRKTLFPTIPSSTLSHHPLPYEVLQYTKNLQELVRKYQPPATDDRQAPTSWIPSWSRTISQPDDEKVLKEFCSRIEESLSVLIMASNAALGSDDSDS